MPMPQDFARLLYQRPAEMSDETKGFYRQYSNADLLALSVQAACGPGDRANPLKAAAEVFMRPRMAMRYSLLPALAQELDYSRPVAGNNCPPAGTEKEALARSLAMITRLADPAWEELPQAWWVLGSALESDDLELAREAINIILARSHVDEPMRFLQSFCEPQAEDADWIRYFWLSKEDMRDFEYEKKQTVERIQALDEEDAPDDTGN